MTLEELKQKSRSLPLLPGVYLMLDAGGKVIYVGKAKKLRNRVSQYFRNTASHSPKTRRMVSQVDRFETIVASSEFEALVLECSLIKQHMPRYNILLKDDKGYPYIRVDLREEYPVMELAGKTAEDGASYFGPYGGRYVSQKFLDTIRIALRLPGCSAAFRRGKQRTCLNYHLGNCEGWCREEVTAKEYRERIDQAVHLLRGGYKQVSAELREKMLEASDALRFEEAAALRDRLKALEALKEKQLVTAGNAVQTDAVGYYSGGGKSCFSVLHFWGGSLVDKDYQILPEQEDAEEAIGALLKQYYLLRGSAPKEILIPTPLEDAELFAELLQKEYGKKVTIRVPQRGEGAARVALAAKNAQEEAERVTTKEEKRFALLRKLQQLLNLPDIPHRIEAYDISNTAGTDIVASMTVFSDGKPLKRDYRRFQIRGLADQDDYASMRQVIERRFRRFLEGDEKFSEMPDLLLIDGGEKQAACAEESLQLLSLKVPVFGMVKDDRHRTRALVTSSGHEIGISAVPALFALIGNIQEETHRFAIAYHRKLQSRRVRGSTLQKIPGIGEKRSRELLKSFGSIAAIRDADLSVLRMHLPENAAQAVYHHFHKEEESV
ncbi:MAG: excinuclease ABC subunit UvrC [Oscillospiraceae bacterium]|nr:excinuclease ABC subunit UvrC [Oscillospiraceae bacterium]